MTTGPWTMVCIVQVPCGVPKANCPTCGNPPGSTPAGGNPINFTNGNTYIKENDVNLPGLGGGLKLDRNWNSIWPANDNAYEIGIFGPGWISTYEERVFQGPGNASAFMGYLQADGTLWWFSNGNIVAPANVSASLAQNGTQSWTITFQNREQRTFDYASGLLTSITDRNGNTTTLAYNVAPHLLTTVTDPAGRHLYFTYETCSQNSTQYSLVTGITSDFGVSASYSYDNQCRLAQVTEPDSSTLNFQYDANSRISAVLDTQGVILETHTYDTAGHGLTSSRANGVDAITVTYQ